VWRTGWTGNALSTRQPPLPHWAGRNRSTSRCLDGYGRAALQIHVALTEPLNWRDPRLAEIPLIHLSDGSPSTGTACAEAEAGLLPRCPTVVVGQQYLLDPTRVPAGTAALWLQLQEVPFASRGDAAGQLDTVPGWTKALAEGYGRSRSDRGFPRCDQEG
jgi:phytoene dehydrogenase-like protein